MRRHIIRLAIAGTSTFVFTATAQASSVQTVMPVTALNISTCAVTALPLAFGTLNQIVGSGTDSQTTLTVTCTPGVSYNVGLDNGTHAAAGVRQMQAAVGTATIPYHVYSDAARTTHWGNTVGTDTVSGTATALPASLTVYGRVAPNATLVAAGAYADAVTVTVTF